MLPKIERWCSTRTEDPVAQDGITGMIRSGRRTMNNPLRCPIVLIAFLALMVGYVHLYHRNRAAGEVAGSVADEAATITLRMTPDRRRASILRTRRPVGTESFQQHLGSSTDAELPLKSAPVATSVPIPLPDLASADGGVLNTAPTLATSRRNSTTPRFIRTPREGESIGSADGPARRPFGTRHPDAKPTKSAAAAESPPVRGPKAPAAYTRRAVAIRGGSDVVMHRVVDGDTLRRLAERYLGDEASYMDIFHANRKLLVQPDLLPLGEKLMIPKPSKATIE